MASVSLQLDPSTVAIERSSVIGGSSQCARSLKKDGRRGRRVTIDRKSRPIFGPVCCQDALTADVRRVNQLVAARCSILYRESGRAVHHESNFTGIFSVSFAGLAGGERANNAPKPTAVISTRCYRGGCGIYLLFFITLYLCIRHVLTLCTEVRHYSSSFSWAISPF